VQFASIRSRIGTRSAKLLRIASWSFILIAAAVLLAALTPPKLSGTLQPSAMTHEQGAAFIVPLTVRAGFAYMLRGPLVGKEPMGRLVLLENEIPLGPGNSLHEFIRTRGSGAYSHWGDALYFSSLDGSDPRKNGRVYTYRAQAALKPVIGILGVLAALCAGLCFSLLPASVSSLRIEAARTVAVPRRFAVLGAIASAVATLWLAYLLALPYFQPPETIALRNESITYGTGYAYYTEMRSEKHWPWRETVDLLSVLLPNPPELLEDGASIGRMRAEPHHVAREGAGRLSSFDDVLVLSSSDGTDPRRNGRRYELKTPVVASPSALLGALALLLFGAIVAMYGRMRRLALNVSYFGPTTRRAEASALIDGVVVAMAALSATAVLVFLWWSGRSGHLGVAAYFPVSDALGYYRCAVAIGVNNSLDAPGFSGEWCARRALYPVMLNALLGISGWRPSLALIMQASMIGLAVGVFILALHRSFGWFTALATGLGVLVAAREFALGNFMTESLGLSAALAGFSLVLLSLRSWPHAWLSLAAGFALVSLAMAIRAGALLVLPALALWLVLVSYRLPARRRWTLWVTGAIALAVGILLQFAVLYRFDMDPGATASNAATSLYGLSTGSRDWHQGYRDFAESFRHGSEARAFKEIQAAALANIRAHPDVFLQSLLGAGAEFLRGMFRIGVLTQLNGILTALFWLGAMICILYRRHLPFAVLLAILAGEILSAPLVYDSGGHRVFIVTLPARLAVAGLGAAVIISLVTRFRYASVNHADVHAIVGTDRWPRRLAACLAAIMTGTAVIPQTPLATPFRLQAVAKASVCQPGEREIVARVGHESMRLAFVERAVPVGDERLGVPYETLREDPTARGAWWLAELKPQPVGTTLFYAVQRSREDPGALFTAYTRHPLPADSGAFVSLCVMDNASAPKLGDLGFLQIVRWRLRSDL
jgi:hypothetical protein